MFDTRLSLWHVLSSDEKHSSFSNNDYSKNSRNYELIFALNSSYRPTCDKLRKTRINKNLPPIRFGGEEKKQYDPNEGHPHPGSAYNTCTHCPRFFFAHRNYSNSWGHVSDGISYSMLLIRGKWRERGARATETATRRQVAPMPRRPPAHNVKPRSPNHLICINLIFITLIYLKSSRIFGP